MKTNLSACIAGLSSGTAFSGCKPPSSSENGPERTGICSLFKHLSAYFEEKETTWKIGEALACAHHYYSKCSATNHLPGIAYGVVVDDSLLFFGGSGTINLKSGAPVTQHSLFRIASMSKSFTAMAILKLRDEGLLSLSDPAHKYIPELEHLSYLTADATPVSIFNLLTMTAGFPEDNPWGDRFLDITDETLMEQVEEGIPFFYAYFPPLRVQQPGIWIAGSDHQAGVRNALPGVHYCEHSLPSGNDTNHLGIQ